MLSLIAQEPAQAQTIVESPQADHTSLTIYPRKIAMVRENRIVNLPAGRSTIRILGVSDKMVAQTALLQSFEGIRLESNFDSDLISKGSILNKSVGETIRLQRVNPISGETHFEFAKILSAPQTGITVQGVVFETSQGVETLYCSGLTETILMNNLPDGVNSVPVLTMDVVVEEAGEKEIVLSYITKGIGWAADYRFDADETKMKGNLLGWLTIRNNTSKSFKDAPTAVIAGNINLDRGTRPDEIYALRFSPKCWEKGSTKTGTPSNMNVHGYNFDRQGYWGGDDEIIVTATKRQQSIYDLAALDTGSTEVATEEDFADFKLYRTARPVTVAALQKKQVAFVNNPEVDYKVTYKLDLDHIGLARKRPTPENTDTYFEIDNSKDGSLAKALPKGIVRVMTTRENGQAFFRGEAEIADLAIGLPIKLNIGKSPLVQVLPNITIQKTGEAMSLNLAATISNATDAAAELEIRFPVHGLWNSDFFETSHPLKTGQTIPVFPIEVAPNSFSQFQAKLPLVTWIDIQHGYQKYARKEPDDAYEFSAKSARISLADNPTQSYWVRRWFKQDPPAFVLLNANVTSIEEVGNGRVEIEEIFQFTNKTASPVKVMFNFPRNEESRIISSSMDRYSEAFTKWPRWVIHLDAKESKTLSIKSSTPTERDY